MKMFIVLLSIAFCLASAADQQVSETQQTNTRAIPTKVSNAIPAVQKQEPQYYSTAQLQQTPHHQYYPVQYVQSPVYQQQQYQHYQQSQGPHQPAMIIIAQPATPQHYLTSAAQQLLQYFHANPQARVQFLQGNFIPNVAHVQPQVQAQYVQQQSQQTPYYQLVTSLPQQQYQLPQGHQYSAAATAVPTQQTPSYTAQDYSSQQSGQSQYQYPQGSFGQTSSLSHISALAQLAAQKYVPPVPIPSYRTPSPIITGLENFTPEQQAQIKEQLSTGSLGSTPLKSSGPIDASALQAIGVKAATQDSGSQDYQSSDSGKSSAQGQSSNTNTNYNYNTYNKG